MSHIIYFSMRTNIHNKPPKLDLNVTCHKVTIDKEETPTFTGQRFPQNNVAKKSLKLMTAMNVR